MVSNIIKLSLGSILFLFTAACLNKPKSKENTLIKKKLIDICRYYAYDVQQIVSNLGCYNCHILAGNRLNEISTFEELAKMDSLKLIDYAFTKKHKGWYSKTGSFKTARMDTLTDCEIKNVIRYIKDAARNIPMPSH